MRLRAARSRGTVLIFVLGIVALLAFLVAAFATETTVEARAARNRCDGEAARLVARAGIERSHFELQRAVRTPGAPVPWLMADVWDYAEHRPVDALPRPSTIDSTRTPSLGVTIAIPPEVPVAGTAAAAKSSSVLPWPSGFVGSTYYRGDPTTGFLGDYYTLKITDANALVNVNDRGSNLAKILDNLAAIVAEDPTSPVPDARAGLGAKLVAARPAAGFARLAEVEAALVAAFPATGAADFAALEPYLTCVSRIDRSVVRGHSGSPAHPDLTLEPRAPINVNVAPRAVLRAVLTGLAGRTPDGTTWTLGDAQAAALAEAFIAYRMNPTLAGGNTAGDPSCPTRRYGFATWAELQAFLLSPASGIADSPQLVALVLANANPNTDVNDLVPDEVIYRCIDKTDLTESTTELSLRPGGIFIVDSVRRSSRPTARRSPRRHA